MAYNPTEWATGDIITAEKLNKMENGIAGAGLQLYGPYYASGEKSISANSQDDINLTTIEDVNGISVILPATDAVILFASVLVASAAVSNAALVMTNFEAPAFDEEWIPAHIGVLNDSERTLTVTASMTLYSTVEFPPLA